MSDFPLEENLIKYPHDDNVIKYDYNRHRYYLTEDAIYKDLGINFNNIPSGTDANPSDFALRWSKKVSEEVYRYILKDSLNVSWLTFELATVPELRNIIIEMLYAQAEYAYNSGFSDTFSGVDMYRGKVLDRQSLVEASISPAVEDYAHIIIPSLGRSLKYAGRFGGIAPAFSDNEGNAIY